MLALFNTQTTDWIIGDTNYTSNVSDTYFDEIRFYNRTLSASEVAALYGSVQ